MNPVLLWLGLLAAAPATEPGADTAQAMLSAEGAWTSGQPGAVNSDSWWTGLNDPGLNQLVDDALVGNHDLATTFALVDLSRAQAWQMGSYLLPSVSFDINAGMVPTEDMAFGPQLQTIPDFSGLFEALEGLSDIPGVDIPEDAFAIEEDDTEDPDTYISGSAMFNVVAPIDLFGRQTFAWKASRHDARAREGDRDAAAIAVVTGLSEAWYDLIAARERVRLVEAQITANRDLLELVEMRFERGQATGLDVLQQRQQLAATESALPGARRVETLLQQRLAVTTGRPPVAPLPVDVPAALPTLPATPHVGSPSDLLRTRPELASAISSVDAARARKISAALAMTPTFALSAGAGRQFYRWDDWENQDTWQVGAAVSVPLFNGGRNIAGVKAARASEEMADRALRSAVLTAVSDVEMALLTERASAEELAAIQRQLDNATLLFTESRDRYIAGMAPYLNVLTAQAALQGAQMSELSARRAVLSARIQLHDALGGTWTDDLSRPTAGAR